MNDDETSALAFEVQKLSPSEGDVIAVKVPRSWDQREMWETLKEIRDQGVQIVAFTDEVELSVIKDFHQYMLTIPTQLTAEQVKRIKGEWNEFFPKATLMVVSGASGLVDVTELAPPVPDPADDISTL